MDGPRTTLTPESSSSISSAGSRSRAPPRTTFASAIAAKPGMLIANERQQRPVSTASPIPSRKPLTVVSGVLKSACASSHSTPRSPRPLIVAAAIAPNVTPQLPPSTIGNAPFARAARARTATCRYSEKLVAISADAGGFGPSRPPGSTYSASTSWPSARRLLPTPWRNRYDGPRPIRHSRRPESYGTSKN